MSRQSEHVYKSRNVGSGLVWSFQNGHQQSAQRGNYYFPSTWGGDFQTIWSPSMKCEVDCSLWKTFSQSFQVRIPKQIHTPQSDNAQRNDEKPNIYDKLECSILNQWQLEKSEQGSFALLYKNNLINRINR